MRVDPSPPDGAALALDSSECPDCLTQSGLCRSCQRAILPQLAVNVGWLKLMGEVRTEQTTRQRKRALPVSSQQAAHLQRKAAARRGSRGYLGLARAIAAA